MKESRARKTDPLGLAAFTIIGVAVAVESRSTPLWVWGPLLAVLTGAGVESFAMWSGATP